VLDPKSATVAIDGSGEVVVALNRDAILQHSCGSRPSDLSSFVPGEPVVIVGRLEESTIRASEFRSLYHEIESEVEADMGQYLRTTAGIVHVSDDVRKRSSVSVLPPAFSFRATVWTDPRTGDYVACLIKGA
jgi:hypothetical protein